ncbi:MAG: hypothetical protein CBC47_02520 [Alphaproteobacteria bacterium TMED87]|nr:hypothetical protein [Rhodospirillaceae bacterium]OUV10831.1 MAG: hypothetical protein CBC47_02520 [Alphaproteobacteria bacterium TMED87]
MHKFLLLFFILLPFLELYLFLKIASLTGFTFSFIMLFFTCGIGLYILKFCSFTGFFNITDQIKEAKNHTKKIFKHICIMIGGVLLVFPGFLTAFISLFIFLPFFQNILYKTLSSQFFNMMNQNMNASNRKSQVIDVDYVTLDEKK